MSENWDFYPCRVEGEPASIMVNMGLAAEVPAVDLTDCVWLHVPMKDPRPDGLSSSAEFERLCEIGDALDAAVKDAATSLEYVGRCTSGGRRDFYAYAEDGLVGEAALSQMMAAFPEYEFETGFLPDPEWRLYTEFLYPTEISKQIIKNRRVLEVLEKHGDPLSEPRPIRHVSYFSADGDVDGFCREINAAGFSLIRRDFDDESQQYAVMFERTDPADFARINDLTLTLLDLAKSCGGDYDGWETQVRTPAADEPTDETPTEEEH